MFSPFSIASSGFLFLYKQGQVGEDVLGYLLQRFPCCSLNIELRQQERGK